MTREVVLDTETTGFDPYSGDRIVEIGCVELVNHLPTGQVYHQYINPERDMPDSAFRVHGLSEEFLSEKPVFADIADAFLTFIGDDQLVIHNASFDMKFINAELDWLGKAVLPMDRAEDTLDMARKKFPGSPASLDALCKRFGVDNTGRDLHGALLDSELLAEVYLQLIGGREPGLGLLGNAEGMSGGGVAESLREISRREMRPPRPHSPTKDELAAHKAFLEKIKDPVWFSHDAKSPRGA